MLLSLEKIQISIYFIKIIQILFENNLYKYVIKITLLHYLFQMKKMVLLQNPNVSILMFYCMSTILLNNFILFFPKIIDLTVYVCI